MKKVTIISLFCFFVYSSFAQTIVCKPLAALPEGYYSGETVTWRDGKTYEIQMAGSLIKNKDKWLFKQICFSYPAPLKIVKQ